MIGESTALVAESPKMQAILATVESIVDTHATVLILGESGVGKDVASQGNSSP